MGQGSGTQHRHGGRVRGALVLALLTVALVACGDTEEQSLCPVYEEFLVARDKVAAVVPSAETAADLRGIAEAYLAKVRQLREAADGRYSDPIDALEVAVADVVRTLESIDADAPYATWAPLVEDSVEDARDAGDRVEELIGPECTQEVDT
jgi:hypothetical protein